MKTKIKDHALSLAFAVAFLLALGGQSIAGFFDYNEKQNSHGAPIPPLGLV